MLRVLLSATLLLWTLPSIPGVFAQDSNATCSQNTWTINSRQQTPCLVAAYLQGACEPDGGWTVVALPNTSLTYVGPSASQASVCTCSSVAFSLVSGCSFCQGGELPFWSDWIVNCPNSLVSNGSYPHTIPSGTGVPAWAYIPINSTQTEWDSNLAQTEANVGFPESSQSLPAQATPTSSSSSSSSGSSSSASTSATSHSSGSSSNVGPIVGGVVGGILGLAIIALIAFFLYRYFKAKEQSIITPAPFVPPSTGPSPAIPEGKYPISPSTLSSGNPLISTPSPPPPVPAAPPMKLYNPEDPSTFPTFQQDPPSANGIPVPQPQPQPTFTPNRYSQF